MDEKTRAILNRPFAPRCIKTRTGPGGVSLSYVEIQHYLARLNEAFDGRWSYEITHREQFEDQVVVQVRIQAGDVVKTGIGGSVIQRGQNGRIPNLADVFKAAEADAIKRAARMLGIGAELYGDEHQTDAGPPHAARGQQPSNGRITRGQLAKLRELVSELGGSWDGFRAWVRTERGTNLEYTTRADASSLINELIAKARARRGNGHAEREHSEHERPW